MIKFRPVVVVQRTHIDMDRLCDYNLLNKVNRANYLHNYQFRNMRLHWYTEEILYSND
jgi:hypothetical protein